MRRCLFLWSALLLLLLPGLSGCLGEPAEDGEALARRHCQGCHRFTPPDRLDKERWQAGVLPRMAHYLGLRQPPYAQVLSMGEAQQMREAGIFPPAPLLDTTDWKKIVAYYRREAPDSLVAGAAGAPIRDSLTRYFHVRPVDLGSSGGALTSLLHWAPEQALLYVGDGRNQLFRVDGHGAVVDVYPLDSPPVAVQPAADGGAYLLTVGFIRPNNRPRGRLYYLTPQGALQPLLDGLPRPVDMAWADLDGDGRQDVVICGFGHFTGRLAWYRNRGDHRFEERMLLPQPGALKTYVRDLDGDGRLDILTLMAQGDERIVAHYNRGDGRFEAETLLRFEPVFGSSYFEPLDYDGDLDLLYVNGDNADYSMILKPYHGIRLYENRAGGFEEAFFLPLPGAYKAAVLDFDGDGDRDIAAISFFPDFEQQPSSGFVLFENSAAAPGSERFQRRRFDGADRGRWLTLEAADLNRDERPDLVLGSFIYSPAPTPAELRRRWQDERTNLLILYGR